MIPFLSLIAAGAAFYLVTLACTGWLANRSARVLDDREYDAAMRREGIRPQGWFDEGRWS